MTAEPDVQFTSNASHAEDGGFSGGEADAEAATESTKSGRYTGWLAVMAMASGLVLGILLAASFGIGTDIRAGDGLLFAQGALAQALSDEMSGSHGIGPTFWSKDGYFCRAFDTRKDEGPGLDGIACRERAGWHIRIVTTATGPAAMPASVQSTMNDLIVGSPLDAAAERQARRQGWRPG
ncbi:MAG: hypothetical protein KGO48_02550 [Alphaproteobacteria bacterium]|nr:hypothetical protein [Alphaproteobacteria bacterium]